MEFIHDKSPKEPISRAKALERFDKIWDHGVLIENFNFDRETQRKMDRFKEFLFENLSSDCLATGIGRTVNE